MEMNEMPELIKGFLLSPTETFRKVREAGTGEALMYLAVLTVIFSVLAGIVAATGIGNVTGSEMGSVAGVAGGIVAIPFVFVAVLIGTIIGGVILHIFVYLVGGRQGIGQTIKAVIYAQTPNLLLGWIPFLGVITGIWTLVLEILGIRELQKLTTGRAVLAVLLPVILAIILAFLASTTISGMVYSQITQAGM